MLAQGSCCAALLSVLAGCATADGEGKRATRVARGARRWLARNAAGVKQIRSYSSDYGAPLTCTILIGCLPTLEIVKLGFSKQLLPDKLSCLVEALACCPRLKALDMLAVPRVDEEAPQPFPASGCAPAFAKLRSLTRLSLVFNVAGPTMSPAMIKALAQLERLVELELDSCQFVTLPAALGQLKRLRELHLSGFSPCVLEAGSLNLPNLTGLSFDGCAFVEGEATLPGVTALVSLKIIDFHRLLHGLLAEAALLRSPSRPASQAAGGDYECNHSMQRRCL